MFTLTNKLSYLLFSILILFAMVSVSRTSDGRGVLANIKPTPTPLVLPANSPGSVGNPVARNADWTPIEKDFDGFIMMLVPTGCFDMGSDTFTEDEKPVNQQCFDAPFWIDKDEVKQSDFVRMGGEKESPNAFKEDNHPVEMITWVEARKFCEENRQMRLPTEAEWEYAARGPDNLIYPWGNTWNKDNAVWNGNSTEHTADVGSHPEGASWVGALDMSGNVREWMSTLYQPYPYNTADGREADTEPKADAKRVVRGGSWDRGATSLTVVVRDKNSAEDSYFNKGFRCASSS